MFLGSYNGFILINLNEHIYLWNPATRFWTKVLELDRLNEDYRTHGGICFDSSKNVYKAVLIMRHLTPDYGGESVIVASLEDKQWREIEFPYDISSVSEGITLQGRLYYKVRVKKSYVENNNAEDDDNNGNKERQESVWDRFSHRNKVIFLDPISEKFKMFPVPDPKSYQEENVIVGLGVINECLCMTRMDGDKNGVEILVMKEYGVKESWTSLIFIRNLEINSSYEFAVPFSMTETGEVALIIGAFDKKITVYNPMDDNMRDILVEPEFIFGDIITYVESLISPEEYYWSEEQHKMTEHNRTKIAWIPSS
ncbi:F-box/kelch-repeat protein At3g06240-like [Lycium barbarum]|uniref:F-box/kelch-repeat protein At3g06240-like n=1 Tax=Lycium barbarum TaxID=112863 RepID=UPI00293EB180|nr:F-box/kelch-repeat protein At3g06240-like [Lycium barbarum]